MGPSERVTVTNMDQYNSILMIESLSPDHNGNYSCVARNVAAEVSHTQRLVVHGNPPLGPLQFARRPPDRPSFACARVCARCVRANRIGRARKWKLHVEVVASSLPSTAIVMYSDPWGIVAGLISKKCAVNASFERKDQSSSHRRCASKQIHDGTSSISRHQGT